MKRTFISGISINRNKAIVDLNKHGDIMEDVIDRIKVKEAMNTGEFVDWEDAKQILDKKDTSMAFRIALEKKALEFLETVPKKDRNKLREHISFVGRRSTSASKY